MTPIGPEPPKGPVLPKVPLWLAVVPGLVIATIFASRSIVQTGQAARAISGDVTPKPALTCIEPYGVNLSNSEFYVREGEQFVPRKKTEISTVVSGMVKNDCGETLKSVTISMEVSDDDGKRGSGSVTVSDLGPGQAKPFSKAWMGRITSYQIVKVR